MNTAFSSVSKYLTPSLCISVTNLYAVYFEMIKKRYAEEKFLDSLKNDVIEVYHEKIDETQKEPLIDLLHRQGKKMDPELKKRLQMYAEWHRKDWLTTIYNYMPIATAFLWSGPYFPVSVCLISWGFVCCSLTNFDLERQIISGGKIKAELKYIKVPKQEKVKQYFGYAAVVAIAATGLKVLFSRYNIKAQTQVLKEWRNRTKK